MDRVLVSNELRSSRADRACVDSAARFCPVLWCRGGTVNGESDSSPGARRPRASCGWSAAVGQVAETPRQNAVCTGDYQQRLQYFWQLDARWLCRLGF